MASAISSTRGEGGTPAAGTRSLAPLSEGQHQPSLFGAEPAVAKSSTPLHAGPFGGAPPAPLAGQLSGGGDFPDPQLQLYPAGWQETAAATLRATLRNAWPQIQAVVAAGFEVQLGRVMQAGNQLAGFRTQGKGDGQTRMDPQTPLSPGSASAGQYGAPSGQYGAGMGLGNPPLPQPSPQGKGLGAQVAGRTSLPAVQAVPVAQLGWSEGPLSAPAGTPLGAPMGGGPPPSLSESDAGFEDLRSPQERAADHRRAMEQAAADRIEAERAQSRNSQHRDPGRADWRDRWTPEEWDRWHRNKPGRGYGNKHWPPKPAPTKQSSPAPLARRDKKLGMAPDVTIAQGSGSAPALPGHSGSGSALASPEHSGSATVNSVPAFAGSSSSPAVAVPSGGAPLAAVTGGNTNLVSLGLSASLNNSIGRALSGEPTTDDLCAIQANLTSIFAASPSIASDVFGVVARATAFPLGGSASGGASTASATPVAAGSSSGGAASSSGGASTAVPSGLNAAIGAAFGSSGGAPLAVPPAVGSSGGSTGGLFGTPAAASSGGTPTPPFPGSDGQLPGPGVPPPGPAAPPDPPSADSLRAREGSNISGGPDSGSLSIALAAAGLGHLGALDPPPSVDDASRRPVPDAAPPADGSAHPSPAASGGAPSA